MKKIFLSLSAALIFTAACVAQSTTVTATITDTDGFAWKGGTYSFTFVPRSDGPFNINQYTWTGGALSNPIIGALDSSGAMSVSIPSTSAISPNQTQWLIQICPSAPSGCFQYKTAITGGSLNLTSTLSTLANGPRFIAQTNNYGYGTVELLNLIPPGAFFYNNTTAACQQYTGSAWVSCSSTGGGATVISSGASALNTNAIASTACDTTSIVATGVLATDAIQYTPNASIKAVTGYVPATAGGLSVVAYPNSGHVNFDVCNWSSGSITPGAVTLNWKVMR